MSLGFRMAIGRCNCAKPYRDALQAKACEAINLRLDIWQCRLPADLAAVPTETHEETLVEGHHITFGTYKHILKTGGTLVVFQALIHTWARPTFFSLGAVGRIYAEGLVVESGFIKRASAMLDYEDFLEKGELLFGQGRWAEALVQYERSRDLNPGDTVGKYSLISAERRRLECLPHLVHLLAPLIAEINAHNARTAGVLTRLAHEASQALPEAERAALASVVSWALSLDDPTLGPLLVSVTDSGVRPLPLAVLRRALSTMAANLAPPSTNRT